MKVRDIFQACKEIARRDDQTRIERMLSHVEGAVGATGGIVIFAVAAGMLAVGGFAAGYGVIALVVGGAVMSMAAPKLVLGTDTSFSDVLGEARELARDRLVKPHLKNGLGCGAGE
jgi:hypothetical protein